MFLIKFNKISLFRSLLSCMVSLEKSSKLYSSTILLTLPIRSTELVDLWFLVPEIFLFFSLVFVLLHYTLRLVKVIKEYQKQIIIVPELNLIQYDRIIQTFNIGTLIITKKVIRILKITLMLMFLNPVPWASSKFLFNGFLVSTPDIMFVKVMILLTAIIILKANFIYLRFDGLRTGDISIILGYIIFTLLIFVQAYDFFILFLLFEMIALLFYIVLALRQITPNSHLHLQHANLTKYQKLAYHLGLVFPQSSYTILASFTYFLLNVVVTGLLLFSISGLLILFQTTHYRVLLQYLYIFEYLSNPLLLFSVLGLLIVFFFKLAASPFHWWIPAVFEGAPVITIMFLAIPVKIAFFFMFVYILYGLFYSLVYIWQPILICVALLCMIIGSFGLLRQTKLKRFWAYSTINHMGYLLLGLSADSFLGLRAVFVYFFAYIIMNLSFFILVLSIINSQTHERLYTIAQFSRIANFKYTGLAVIFSILLFSLIGIPPLLGFWGKYLIISVCLVSFSGVLAIFILSILITTTLITTICYLRIWKNIFSEKPKFSSSIDIHPIPNYNLNLLMVCNFILIIVPFFALIPNISVFYYIDKFLMYFF